MSTGLFLCGHVNWRLALFISWKAWDGRCYWRCSRCTWQWVCACVCVCTRVHLPLLSNSHESPRYCWKRSVTWRKKQSQHKVKTTAKNWSWIRYLLVFFKVSKANKRQLISNESLRCGESFHIAFVFFNLVKIAGVYVTAELWDHGCDGWGRSKKRGRKEKKKVWMAGKMKEVLCKQNLGVSA